MVKIKGGTGSLCMGRMGRDMGSVLSNKIIAEVKTFLENLQFPETWVLIGMFFSDGTVFSSGRERPRGCWT